MAAVKAAEEFAGKRAAEKAAQLAEDTARGRASEARVLAERGLEKNTTKVATREGRAIPDALTDTISVEIKDTKVVNLDRQARIEIEAAKNGGKTSVLVTGTNTKVSAPAERAWDRIEKDPSLGPRDPIGPSE